MVRISVIDRERMIPACDQSSANFERGKSSSIDGVSEKPMTTVSLEFVVYDREANQCDAGIEGLNAVTYG